MSELFHGKPDIPIESIAADLFDVEPYIEGLSTFIGQCDTPMTISIQGDWGTGKTSMMNLVQKQLGDRVIPIWFNTWMYSQFNMDDALAISMLQTLINGLNLDPESKRGYLTRVKHVGKGLAKVGLTAIGSFFGGEATGAAAAEIVDDSDGTLEFTEAVASLKDDFKGAVEKSIGLSKSADRVVVFIDDLDRLHPERAVELLEVMKIFLDCPRCVFVLAVDYDVVVTGIRQKFGQDIDSAKGKSFFDKIIQLPFKMPVAQYNIDRYVRKMLLDSHIAVPDDEELRRYKELIRTSVGYNPRSMKRLFNSYQLLNIITKGNRDIDLEHKNRVLFAILCMQSRFDRLYAHFAELKGMSSDDVTSLAETPRDRDLSSAGVEDTANGAERDPLESILLKGRGSQALTGEDIAEVKSMRRFMKTFVASLQTDENPELDDEELEAFKSLLRVSTITSTADEDDSDDDDEALGAIRYQNISLAKRTLALLPKKLGFSYWRKNRQNGHWKPELTNVILYGPLNHGIGADYQFHLIRNQDSDVLEIAFWTGVNARDREAIQRLHSMFDGRLIEGVPVDFDAGQSSFWLAHVADLDKNEDEGKLAKRVAEIIRSVQRENERRAEEVGLP